MSRSAAYKRDEVRQLVQMLQDGCDVPRIARELGRSEDSVRVKISRMRASLAWQLPPRGRPRKLAVPIRPVVLTTLEIHAQARNQHVSELVAEIITVICKDDLFNAVLGDDG